MKLQGRSRVAVRSWHSELAGSRERSPPSVRHVGSCSLKEVHKTVFCMNAPDHP